MKRLVLALALLTGGCDVAGVSGDDTGLSATDTAVVTGDTGTPAQGEPVTTCANDFEPVQGQVCRVIPGSNGWQLLQGDVLAPYEVFEHGTVLLDSDGMIACTGCDCADEPEAADATVINCPEGVISAGLVNPHEHITYSENAPLPPSSTRYDHRHEWREALSTPSNPSGTTQTSAGTRWVELRQAFGGATTLVGSGRATGMLRNPDGGGAHNLGIDLPYVDNETFPLGDANRQFRSGCGWNYTTDAWAALQSEAYVPHIAEGIDDYAAEEARCTTSMFDGARDFTNSNAAHVHAIGLTTEQYRIMADAGTVLVWSPRSNLSLYSQTAQVALFERMAGHIALSTDWSYSGSIHMVRELACAAAFNENNLSGHFSDGDLWRMATLGAARALQADHMIGALLPGMVGDIAVFDGRQRAHHRAVIDAGADDVRLVLRGGVPLLGEAYTVGELRDDCDPVDVCGTGFAVCTEGEYGVSLAELQADAAGAYPLFFCDDVPTNEPSCVPARDDATGTWPGLPTDGDADGDGLADEADNCPLIFNPVRPMDGGVQPDLDDDGIGDACDPTPLDLDPDDDGLLLLDDNCWLMPNEDQADADGDGLGDACDVCPDAISPEGPCPPASATVPDIRTDLSDDVVVTVSAVVVTGVGSSGFYIQDPTVTDGIDAGLYVYTGSSPGVDVGDEVTVTGTTATYYGERQLTDGQASVTGTGTITPLSLTASEATSEDYEGVLVTVSGTVTSTAYDCTDDHGSCGDENLWEVGGASGVVVYDRLYEGADWADHIGGVPVTGVMGWRFDRRRLMPRAAGDFSPLD